MDSRTRSNPIIATLLLAVAGWLILRELGDKLPLPLPLPLPANRITIPPEHQLIAAPVQRMMANHPQRAELGAFYAALADLVPKLPSNATAHQVRRWFETAAQLQFSDSFQRVPGLADAIHGPNGIIAQIYGTDAGPLNRDAMRAALRAVAWACGA